MTLIWSTASETENLGFHVYRSRTEEGPYTRITPDLVRGAGSSWTTQTYRFVDRDVREGVRYFYKIEDVDFSGNVRMHGPVGISIAGMAKPSAFMLHQNHPNPFNANTEIQYALPEERWVRVVTYNTAGQVIRVLVEEQQEGGYYTAYWNGRDGTGKPVGTGLYLYALQTKDFASIRKMLVLR